MDYLPLKLAIRKFRQDTKGQGVAQALITAPILVLFLLIALSLLDPIISALFNVLDNAKPANIAYIGTIKVIVSLIGLILGIYVVLSIINEFQRTRQQGQFV